MKYLFIFLLTICFIGKVSAHSPDISSTVLVENAPNQWTLQIIGSLTAFEYAVEAYFPDEEYSDASEFNQLFIRLVRAQVEITADGGEAVKIGKAAVKLGHESQAVFELSGFPAEFNSLTVENKIFEQIHNSVSALVILKDGFEREQFLLNDDNEYISTLTIDGNKIMEMPEVKLASGSTAEYVVFCSVFLLLGWLVYITVISPVPVKEAVFIRKNQINQKLNKES